MHYKKSGFTLIELMLVLGVGAILMGIAGINFANQRKNSNLSRAVQNLSQDIKFARSKAISNGTSWRLKSNGEKEYSIESFNENSGTWENIRNKTLTRGTAFSSTFQSGKLEFDTRGYMNINPPDLLIAITNGESTKTIIPSMTGSLIVLDNND